MTLLAAVAIAAAFAPNPDVRVMSYNVRYATAKDGENHWDKRKDFLFDTVKAFGPDLLGTQETLAVQRDFLAGKMPDYGVFGVGRDDGKEAGEMMAVFWRKDRFEKADGGHFWLSETPETVGSKGWDALLPRLVTWVKLTDKKSPGAKPVLWFNTHFDHRGAKARVESAKLLRGRIPTVGKDCSVIVTGDFNATEEGDVYAALFGKVKDEASPVVDAFRAKHPTKGADENTASGFRANKVRGSRIDWIGCSRDWTVKDAGIDRTARDGRTASDHFAVTAVLGR